MLDQVRVLHNWRQEKAALDAVIKDARADCENNLAEVLAERGALEIAITVSESELKAQRVADYNVYGSKDKVFGIGIREVTKLDYCEVAAFEWAVNHELALKLDKKGFEKIARIDTPDFVTVYIEPQATIAQDLSEYVKGE